MESSEAAVNVTVQVDNYTAESEYVKATRVLVKDYAIFSSALEGENVYMLIK